MLQFKTTHLAERLKILLLSKKPTREQVKRMILSVSIILSAILVFYSISGSPVKPFATKISIKNSSFCYIEKNGSSLIIDDDGKRLLFIDGNSEVVKIENLNKEAPIDKATFVACDGKNHFVLGVRTTPDSSVDVDEITVVKYDLDGTNRQVVYCTKLNPQEKENAGYGVLTDMDILSDFDAIDGILYISEFHNFRWTGQNTCEYNLKVTRVNSAKPGDVNVVADVFAPYLYIGEYFPPENKVYFCDYLGRFAELEDGRVTYLREYDGKAVEIFRILDNGEIVWFDAKTLNSYVGDRLIIEKNNVLEFGKSKSGVTWISEDMTLHQMDDNGETQVIKEVDLSPFFSLIAMFETMAYIWLIFLFLRFTVEKIKTLSAKGEHATLFKIGMITIAVFSSLLIASYYTKEIISSEKAVLEKEIHQQCTLFSEVIDGNEIKNAPLRRISDEIPSFAKLFDVYTELSQQNGDFTYVMMLKNDNGTFSNIYDSRYRMIYGSVMDYYALSKNADSNPNHVGTFSQDGYSFKYAIQPVKDKDGTITGAVLIAKDCQNIEKKAWQDSIWIAIELFTIFISIYVLVTETNIFLKDQRKNKKKREYGSPCPELALSHTYSFVLNLMSAFDGVLLVLISKRILAVSFLSKASIIAFLMTIPSVAVSAGAIIGAGLYGILSRNFTIRKLITWSVCATFFSHCLIVWALTFTEKYAFVIFCAMKLLSSTANTCTSCALSGMSMRSENATERFEASMDRFAGQTASNMVGTLIGGLVLNSFGYRAIYIISAAVSAPAILIFLLTLPKQTPFRAEEEKIKKANVRNLVRFMLNPRIIFYFVFLTLPMLAISGYKSFLFPLYSSGLNMPEMYIAAITVFAHVVENIVSAPVVNLAKKYDHWVTATAGLGIVGIFLMQFSVRPGIKWAIVVLFVIYALDSQCNTSREILWPRMTEKYNLTRIEVSGTMFVTKQIISTLTGPLLSLFLLSGTEYACTSFGSFCLISAILFFITTRKSPLRVKKLKNGTQPKTA